MRRRPVPRVWREEHHALDVWSRVVGRAPVFGNVYRARGRCSCGVEFNPARNPDGTPTYSDTLDREAVIDAWKDHVEDAYYERPVFMARTLKMSDIDKCPFLIMVPEHYRDDGTCRCDDHEHREMEGWGYTWHDGRWTA